MTDLLSLIVGALIALISSVVTIVVSDKLQSKREKRKRKREVISERIEKIERGAAAIVGLIDNYMIYAPVPAPSQKDDNEALIAYKNFYETTLNELTTNGVLLLGSESLNNNAIENLIKELYSCAVEYVYVLSVVTRQFGEKAFADVDKLFSMILTEENVDEIEKRISNHYSRTRTDWIETLRIVSEDIKGLQLSLKIAYVELVLELDKLKTSL